METRKPYQLYSDSELREKIATLNGDIESLKVLVHIWRRRGFPNELRLTAQELSGANLQRKKLLLLLWKALNN